MLEKEKIILKKVSEGDEDAFREIFEYYYPKTRVFLEQFISNVEEAQDLAQNIFIKVWLQRSILVDIRSFGAYLYTATRNSAIDYGRTRKRLFCKGDRTPDRIHHRKATQKEKAGVRSVQT